MLPTNIAGHEPLRSARQQVVGLSEHRSRRRRRLRMAEALWSGDPMRAALVRHLSELTEITEADRAAAVWLDEYGTSLVHPHVILDLLSDRPRRSFPLEPLERAWEIGLPGAYEAAYDTIRSANGRNLLAIALGSDGARAWFVVSDSIGARPRLGSEARERLLFLAGECAAVLLHRDLDRPEGDESSGFSATPRRFSGWAILEDLEGREDSSADVAVIEQRFLVGRIVRDLVDDDLVLPRDELVERVRISRSEVDARVPKGGEPLTAWEPALRALEEGEVEGLAETLLEAGERSEAQGHRHGAVELYRCAYDIAAAVQVPTLAVDAARRQGRVHRRFARWDESVRSYRLAQQVAVVADLHERTARVLVGLASVRQENGSLPGARACYMEALELAQRSGEPDALASVHHGLLGLEHAAGNLETALQHGWVAVATYADARARVRCLASLAGVLVDFGDRTAGEDAWTVVAQQSDEAYYRIYAHDALAYLAALRGDLAEFEVQVAACDALDWRSGPISAQAEILYYRGLSYEALGLFDAARRWLTDAVEFSERHGLNRTLFRAEEAIRGLERREADAAQPDKTMPAAPREVREGLREMRRALAGAAS